MKFIMTLRQKLLSANTKLVRPFLIALGILVILGLAYQFAWRGREVLVWPVLQKDFVQTIVASGHVENPHRIDLGAQITGTVLKVPVKEGQLVKAGDLLIELESTEMQAALQQAQANVLQAQARLRQLQEVQTPVTEQALQQAVVSHLTTHNEWLRAQELFSNGFIGQAALEEARRIEQVSTSQVLSLQKQVLSLKPNGSDFFAATVNLSQAQAGVALAKSKLRYASIFAPVAGTLILRNVESGDVVQPGKVLMVLSPDGVTQLVVQIDEKHLRQLQLDQNAKVSADAFSTEQFDAKVNFINPGVDPQRGSVTVKLSVQNPPAYLKQDMTVSLNIEVAKIEQAVLVATGSVHDIDKSPWVQKLVNDRIVNQPIQLGLRDGSYSQVLQGLSVGDLTLQEASALKENMRVHPKMGTEKE